MINDKGILDHYSESKRIISKARHDGQLVIFVGAGASIASGMPAWSQAIKEIEYSSRPEYSRLHLI